ncbi:MAG TPA: hypothetical protein VGP92_05340 [Acidimicrobiia bacterium]|nr:hypothetical protein [Acidimicrobiia bacterium]
MKLDAATFLLQWAAGGLLFGWVTTRRREVSLGYGWLIRSVFATFAAAAAVLFFAGELGPARVIAGLAAVGCVTSTMVALAVSVQRRAAGVRGREEVRAARRARVSAMIGRAEVATDQGGSEFAPVFDLVAPVVGAIGLLAAAQFAGGPYLLAVARLVVGAVFLGSVSDAMLLGHWYLVQPGLPRGPLKELVAWTAAAWPFEVAVFLWPTGMVQVVNGVVVDGYHGVLGWIWIGCALLTIGLVGMTWAALRERYYSAVMAATGLLYLAILTGFGTDLVARAVLRP